MPGKQARVLCPVCQEPIPPDETECENCGAFVIDEAVVRLGRAFGLKREAALKLVEMGFRHPRQLKDRDPGSILQKGEVGLLFICTNCGGFVASGDTKCPRCAAEFESEPDAPVPEEEDILDIVLCPVCGADNDSELFECEICGEPLREPSPAPSPPKVEVAPARTEQGKPAAPVLVPAPPVRPSVMPARKAPLRESPGPTSYPPLPASGTSASKPAARALDLPKPDRGKLVPPRPAAPVSLASPARTMPLRPAKATVTTPRDDATPLPQKRVRSDQGMNLRGVPERIAARVVVAPEIVGGFVLASGAGLLLSGILVQVAVSAGIAAFLAGLLAYVVPMFLRSDVRVGVRDAILLAAGAALGLGVPILHAAGADTSVLGTGMAIASAIPFARATWHLLEGRAKVTLAVGSAVPLIGLALAAAQYPPLAHSIPWTISVLAAIPWPAALAVAEVRRRQSTAALRRELVRAERDIVQEDYQRSLEEYDRAIVATRKGVPGAEIPWYGKGATLILLGRYEEALRAIDTALDINPRNEVAWVNKGNALSKMGRLVDALRCFNAAIKVNPRFEVAWNNKGNALARLGKYEEAVQCYDRALGIDPGYRGAWVNKGFVLTKLGRFDEAASCADRALGLNPGRRAELA